VFVGVHGDLDAIAQVEFGQDVGDMALHGGLAEVEPGGPRELHIPPMPTWALVTVIVGWITVWSAIGAWKMTTRDA
jgi:hypothetical protein